jgi:putative FmdB family regulatory protein
MPLYDYECAKCGKVFEVRQKFSDEPLTTHPDCGGEVTKLLSAPAFQFKGSGWYVTDYAKSGSGAPKSESSGSSETKTESKSAETKSESTKSESTTKSESSSASTTTKSE